MRLALIFFYFMDLIFFINKFLSITVILGQLIILWVIFHFLFFGKKENFISKFIGRNGVLLAFIVVLASIIGSLFYSEVVGYVPCTLCWYQRIFMYPQIILLGFTIFKKNEEVIKYSIGLSAMGALLALYHYLLQFNLFSGLPCPALGSSVSCTKLFVREFGYITLPLMSFTAFLMITVFLVLYRSVESEHESA